MELMHPVTMSEVGLFFFQAEDGIRDPLVTGVQTCALPIWPRPSAAGKDGYDGLASGGSNLGPSNPKLLDAVKDRIAAYRMANLLKDDEFVPVDAVTASASGLDPHISVANARFQARRVAATRGLST